MSFLNSYLFLVRQLSTSMEQWTATVAAFGEERNLKKSGNMKETPQN